MRSYGNQLSEGPNSVRFYLKVCGTCMACMIDKHRPDDYSGSVGRVFELRLGRRVMSTRLTALS